MNIMLTDILNCPRCGAGFGLILLADRVHERRVEAGLLGCSNCREKYGVRGYTVDFGGDAAPEPATPAATELERMAALIGVAQGPAFIMVAGPAAVGAAHVAAMVEDVEVVALGGAAGTTASGPEPGVSRLLVGGGRLPLATGKLAGVALTGAAADALLEEGARVVSPAGRLVLQPAPADAAVRLESSGMRVLAAEHGTTVAVRQ